MGEEVLFNMAGPSSFQFDANAMLNPDATSFQTVVDLLKCQNGSINSPPGELVSLVESQAHATNENALNPADQFAHALDVQQTHETMQAQSQTLGFPAAPADPSATFPFEAFAQFVNASGVGAMPFGDPALFASMSNEMMAMWASMFNFADPTADQLLPPQIQVQDAIDPSMFGSFDFMPVGNNGMPDVSQGVSMAQVAPNVAMHAPTMFSNDMQMSAVSTPTPAGAINAGMMMAHQQFEQSASSSSTESTSAGRYVPPAGAGMTSRRRVGQRFDPRMLRSMGSASDAE